MERSRSFGVNSILLSNEILLYMSLLSERFRGAVKSFAGSGTGGRMSQHLGRALDY